MGGGKRLDETYGRRDALQPFSHKEGRRIGVSVGLSHPSGNYDPEQLLVFVDDSNEQRPIHIEGWHGYDIPLVMNLTRNQAKDLQALLVEALLA